MARKAGTWRGGKPEGSVGPDRAGITVRFTAGTAERKYFSYTKYEGYIGAYAAAIEWQKGRSLERGSMKNMYRVISGDGEPYLEVQLNDGQVMKCDIRDVSFVVTGNTWCTKPDKQTTYAHRKMTGVRSVETFHRLVYPGWEVIDHINRDGLDNRRRNLRDGGGGVNNRNTRMQRNNTSGVTGVSYGVKLKRWIATWMVEGKNHSKYFPGERDDEAAKNAAIAYRQQMAGQLGNTNGT